MKSPFPGMDPYLERHWQDVHQRICTYACDQLQATLSGDLVARLGERLIVESLLDESRAIYPDVRIVKYPGDSVTRSFDSGGGTALAEPIVVEVAGDPQPQAFIEILEPDSGRLITVIEFLSPSNKLAGDGQRQYRKKQAGLYGAEINLVEIDLLRRGPRVFLLPEVQFPPRAKAPYMACVFRGRKPGKFELYPMQLRERIRPIRVPLREQDEDIALDLQAIIDLAYRNGRYDRTDYSKPTDPPLEAEDAAWAEALFREAGRK